MDAAVGVPRGGRALHPEADSSLNCDCGNLIRSGDLRGYRSMARMYTALPPRLTRRRGSCLFVISG